MDRIDTDNSDSIFDIKFCDAEWYPTIDIIKILSEARYHFDLCNLI